MNILGLIILTVSFFVLYAYVAFNAYKLINIALEEINMVVNSSYKIITAIFWLPIVCLIMLFVFALCAAFVVLTPFVIIYILIARSYRKITGKQCLFDTDEVKFEL